MAQPLDHTHTEKQSAQHQKTWRLWPNRSLNRRGVKRVMMFFTFLLVVGALRALLLGAWPVALFLLLDLGAIALAFHLVLNRSRVEERLILQPSQLIIERYFANVLRDRFILEPYWTKIEFIEDKAANHRHIRLRDRGQIADIGAYLTEDDLKDLKRELEVAIAHWRARSN